jgi:hypothetical protein
MHGTRFKSSAGLVMTCAFFIGIASLTSVQAKGDKNVKEQTSKQETKANAKDSKDQGNQGNSNQGNSNQGQNQNDNQSQNSNSGNHNGQDTHGANNSPGDDGQDQGGNNHDGVDQHDGHSTYDHPYLDVWRHRIGTRYEDYRNLRLKILRRIFASLRHDKDDEDRDGHGKDHDKVTICHKGHTITVSRSALHAHLAHGDSLGSCEVTPKKNR